ncbi:hypothetical protein V6N13_108926 [Hibiscus sabdariffa]
MVSQTQQELQRVQSDVQQLQTDLHQVETTVADRCSQVERTIEGTLLSVRAEIWDDLAIFKNDMQSQISGLESMIRKFFEQPRVPTGVTTESLASPAIIDAIPRPVVTVDMLPNIPPPPLLDEGDIPASLETEIQNSTALSLHDVYHTMGLETGLRDPIRGKALMFVVGSSSDFELRRGIDLSDPTRGLLGPKPSIGNELFPRKCGSNSIQVSEPVQTPRGNQPIHDRKRYPIQTSSVRLGQGGNREKTLILQGTKTSATLNSILSEIYHLKKGGAVRFTRKNDNIKPFESGGETSSEFFSLKTDCSLFVKRPNNLVIGRMYDHHVYDLVEVGIENFKSIESFTYDKKMAPRVGAKPFIAFVGEEFENVDELKHLKEVLLDLLRGEALPWIWWFGVIVFQPKA